jgi:predicted TIM-barrel fold metal-dependent hydrolase
MSYECLDIFCHCLPSAYCQAVHEAANRPLLMFERAQKIRVMVDLPARLQMMDQFPGYRQLVSLASPPVEVLAPEAAEKLAMVANNEMAKMVNESDGRIAGFVATLPLNLPGRCVLEVQRAVQELGANGVQVFTSVLGQPLDDPEFEPLFRAMHELDLPILLHPTRAMTTPDYPSEQYSKFDLWWALGWPYETTLAMVRLAMSGIFDRFPNLKIIAHHVGGFLPMLEGRLGPGMELLGTRNPPGTEAYVDTRLQESVLSACKKFYADTASFGSQSAIEAGQAFFGYDRLLFATDMPFDPGQGPDYIRSTLNAIGSMDLNERERQAIFTENARSLFRLPSVANRPSSSQATSRAGPH